jgi:hydroxypyruvate isomerase
MIERLSRRNALKYLSSATAAATFATGFTAGQEARGAELKGNIKHSVSRWCFKSIALDDLCKSCQEIGIGSIELQGPGEWPTIKKYGLTCAMGNGAELGLKKGFNRVEFHDQLIANYEKLISQAADAGIESVICFSGNRDGLADDEGIVNCAKGIKRLMKLCEEKKVNLVMELLNSFGHKDYQCDHTEWGAELCRQVGSDRFGLLYDIYHMQIMEGNVIATIRKNHQYIKHYHTGGCPGRNEIDETQELYYPAIILAIVETGYDQWIGQEFIPSRPDKIKSLREAIKICDV